jgi:hypothetical protein
VLLSTSERVTNGMVGGMVVAFVATVGHGRRVVVYLEVPFGGPTAVSASAPCLCDVRQSGDGGQRREGRPVLVADSRQPEHGRSPAVREDATDGLLLSAVVSADPPEEPGCKGRL